MLRYLHLLNTATLLVISLLLQCCQSGLCNHCEYNVEVGSEAESSIEYVGNKGGTKEHYVHMRLMASSTTQEEGEVVKHFKPVTSVSTREVVNTKEVEGPGILSFRYKETANSTLSRYLLPRTHEDGKDTLGYFLEPKGPATIEPEQNQRIPAGMYRMMNHVGARHQNVPKLFNDYVSPDRYILIHKGQTYENTLGCLLPGVADRGDSIWLDGEDQEHYGSDPSETKFEEMKKYISDNGGYDGVKLHLFDFIRANPQKRQEEEALRLGRESGYSIPFN